jgi:serpin B
VIEALPRSLSVQEEQLVIAGNDFAFRLLQQVHGTAPDSNAFLAPLSASMALGMTLNGAAGTTFEEMRSTLGFGSMTLDDINEGYRNLMDLLLTLDPSVELGIGNSIWYRQDLPVRQDFLDRVAAYFDAVASQMDFASPDAARIINDWVKDQTRGKIQEIVEDPIDAAVVMYLINAVYFKASWTHRFPKNKTEQADFFGVGGDTEPLPLMELKDTVLYAETDSYQVVDLPYGGKAFSMTLLLPRNGTSVTDLIATLDRERWEGIVESLRPEEGTVWLPRFRMEWGRELKDDLRAMGMKVPFMGGQADFSGLSDEAIQRGLYISKVKQKTYVDVNEEGTEAAGVTSVEIRETSAGGPFSFRADRPFLFLLRERFSETILFAGVLVRAPDS